ncbi:MAG: beta-ketoacyl-ACP reductase [Acidimicrobiia bacterium]|nr:MAG: beta-ketoacyl-ACP reductase [Acidimicrobiia bacterium]
MTGRIGRAIVSLADRVALVTGAGRGIGRAIALRLAGEGAAVVVNDIDREAAEETVERLRAAGGRGVAAEGNVADVAACEAAVAAAEAHFGGLDILVNNAGLTADGWLHKMSDQTWALTYEVMLKGTFQMCRAAAHLLRVAKGVVPTHHRKVVNIASINGIYGVAGNTNYSAAKAGVIGLTKALAREWAPQQINVNAVAPGFIEGTRLTAVRGEGEVLGNPGGDPGQDPSLDPHWSGWEAGGRGGGGRLPLLARLRLCHRPGDRGPWRKGVH